jgi:hypothetical protein
MKSMGERSQWLRLVEFFGILRCAQNDGRNVQGKGNNDYTATGSGVVLVGDLVEVAEAAGDHEEEGEDGGVVADVDEGGGHDGA